MLHYLSFCVNNTGMVCMLLQFNYCFAILQNLFSLTTSILLCPGWLLDTMRYWGPAYGLCKIGVADSLLPNYIVYKRRASLTSLESLIRL